MVEDTVMHSDKPTMSRAQVCVEAAAGGQLSATYITSVQYILLGLCRLHFCLKAAGVPVKTLLKGMARDVYKACSLQSARITSQNLLKDTIFQKAFKYVTGLCIP